MSQQSPAQRWGVACLVVGLIAMYVVRRHWPLWVACGMGLAPFVGAWLLDVRRRSHPEPPCVRCERVVGSCACGAEYQREGNLVRFTENGVSTFTSCNALGVWRSWDLDPAELADEHRTFVAEWIEAARRAEAPSFELATRPSWYRWFVAAIAIALVGVGWLPLVFAVAHFGRFHIGAFAAALLFTAATTRLFVRVLTSRVDERGLSGWTGVRTRTIAWPDVRAMRVRFGHITVTARDGDALELPTFAFAEPDWIAALIVRRLPTDAEVRVSEPA